MLSEEEKKEYIEHEILNRLYCLEENDFDKNKVDDGYIKAVLNACKETKNLIEKQSKEIEELKETLKCTQNSWYEDTQKIEEMKKQIDLDNECEIALNNKIIDLENANKKLIDKIKAKIEEVDIQLQKLKDGLTGRKTNFVNKNMLFAQKKVLQSLLEKE